MALDIAAALKWSPVLLVLIILVDLLRARRGGGQARKETFANLGVFFTNNLWRQLIANTLVLTFLTFVSQWRVTTIPLNLGTALLLLLLVDFFYYWYHRFSHEVRALWAFHNVHHSSNEFNVSTAVRLAALGKLPSMFFFLPLVLAGFPPVAVLAGLQINLLYQFWIHSERIGKLGAFDWWFNSPSNHRVHHGSNAQYIDKNHGGILMIWDHLFGTYEPEGETVRYGLTTPLTARDPVTINFHEWARIFHDLRDGGFKKKAWKVLFGYPA